MKFSIAAMIAIGMLGAANAQQITDSSGAALSESEKSVIITGISELLKDPQSANFTKLTKARNVGFCGYVNAKNSMGGYVGPRMFYVYAPAGQWFILPTSLTLQGMGASELANVQKMIPIMQDNCLNAAGNPIM